MTDSEQRIEYHCNAQKAIASQTDIFIGESDEEMEVTPADPLRKSITKVNRLIRMDSKLEIQKQCLIIPSYSLFDHPKT